MSNKILVMNPQTRSANRPSQIKICECGSGKLRKKCCGTQGGSGILLREDVAYCLSTQNGCGNLIVEINAE